MIDDRINVESLLVLAEVIREGSFSAAAGKLRRTKQSVHRQIKKFESDLGLRLLNRTGRSVSPTKVGIKLFHHAERIAAEANLALEAMRKPVPDSATRVRLTATPLFAEIFLSPLIGKCIRANLRIECVLTNDLLSLEDHGIDIAIRIGAALPPLSTDSSYTQVSLGNATRVICASPAYRQAHGFPQSPKELRSHTLLHFGSTDDSHRAVWELGAKGSRGQTVQFAPALASTSPRIILEGVLRGQGIAMLPEMLCAEFIKQKRLVELMPELGRVKIPVVMVVKKMAGDSPGVSELAERIVRAARETSWLA